MSFLEEPALGSVLHAIEVPPYGGDTLWANQHAAYDALSDRMKTYLEGLTAWHDGTPVFGEGTPNANHPVIVRHPDSGRKLIYVNHPPRVGDNLIDQAFQFLDTTWR